MRYRALLVAVFLMLTLVVCGLIATAEELVNDTRKTAVAVRITFRTRVFITSHGREFDTVEPASGLSDVFVFSGGEVRRNGIFEVEWAPGLAIKSVEWLDEEEQAETEPQGVETFVDFKSSPEIGTWSSEYGVFWQGNYRISYPALSTPAVGLFEELSHDSLHIETQALGSGTGIVFGYQDTGNFFAFYQDTSAQEVTVLILAKFSGRTAYPSRAELVRIYRPATERNRIQGSYMAVVVSEGHVECYFDEDLIATPSCEGIPTPSGAGLYFGRTGGYGNSGVFGFLRISQSALTLMPTDAPDTSQLGI